MNSACLCKQACYIKFVQKIIFLWVFSVVSMLGFATCKNPSHLTNYLPLVSKECLFTDQDKPVPFLAPEACKKVLEALIPFDESFENTHPSYGNQKYRVINLLYFLLNHPTRVDPDQKFLGNAPMKDFLPQTLKKLMREHLDIPLHHVLFNYILSSARAFRLTYARFSYFHPLDQTISLTVQPFTDNVEDILRDVTTMIHEARHSETMDHPVYCPELTMEVNECDQGTDGPHGWSATYAWALLLGYPDCSFSDTELEAMTTSFFGRILFIKALPDSIRPLRDDWAPKMLGWEGSLSDPVVLDRWRKAQIQAALQCKPRTIDTKIYTKLAAVCKETTAPMISQCLEELHRLSSHEFQGLPATTRDYLTRIFLLFLNQPFSAQDRLLGYGTLKDFFQENTDFVSAAFKKDDNLNQLFLSLSWGLLMESWGLKPFLSQPRPLPIDPNHPQSEALAFHRDIHQTLWPLVVNTSICRLTCSSEEVESINRWNAAYQWAFLHGQLKLPQAQRLVTEADIDALSKDLCDLIHHLGTRVPLPAPFHPLQTISCQDLRKRL